MAAPTGDGTFQPDKVHASAEKQWQVAAESHDHDPG